jgi:hypothetical protein
MRHSDIGLLKNNKAGEFNKESDVVKKVIKEIKIRCKLAIGKNKNVIKKTEEHIDKLVIEWSSESIYCQTNKIKLVYNSKDRGMYNLICNFEEKNGLWQTLQSMRNIESSALLKLLKGVKIKDEK